ncbi:MAG: hypothetical protein HY840_00790 [Bacteroidetes bacterium]|nr:hypothetical protein [Bacteroidota bacterium]
MISLGFELPGPPPSKEEIRAWRKWKKEIDKLDADLLKPASTPGKKKKKTIKKKGSG